MIDNLEEEWRDIEGYEGLYQVSNLGRVKSLNYHNTGKEQLLKHRNNDKYGHQRVCLCKCGIKTYKQIHRLVAEAFIPNPEKKSCVDHIDTNTSNNCVENLRWVTHHENSQNPLSIIHYRDANGGKPIYCYETATVYQSTKDAEHQLNVHSSNVSNCCRGLRSQTGGYHFCYADEMKKED